MPETFLILLAGGVMLAAAIPNPKDVTLQWLRLAAVIALTMAGLSLFFISKAPANAAAARLALLTAGLVCGQLAFAQFPRLRTQRLFAVAAFVVALASASRLNDLASRSLSLASLAAIAALPGIALMDMLLGHAYLTASQMTMAPFRRLNTSLGIAIILRAMLSIGATMLLNARHPIYYLWNIYGLYILTRWIVGLLIPGIFVWMAHDCIKRRATQSATGILYVAGVLILLGEIIALYLLRQTGLPF